jgi:hypothetical protein
MQPDAKSEVSVRETSSRAANTWLLSPVAAVGGLLFGYDWVAIAENFPNRIRNVGMSLAVSSLWMASFFLVCPIPLLNHSLGPAVTFWIDAGICVLGFAFIRIRLPENNGKTPEEIEQALT